MLWRKWVICALHQHHICAIVLSPAQQTTPNAQSVTAGKCYRQRNHSKACSDSRSEIDLD